jgi:cytochrome c553
VIAPKLKPVNLLFVFWGSGWAMRILISKWRFRFAAMIWVCAMPVAFGQEHYSESQGWGQSQLRAWYELSQGSRLIALSWLEALENSDGSAFFERTKMEGFGYSYFPDSTENMPIGFVVDRDQQQSWLGFNCAACHTAQLKAGNTSVLIHGGQAMADFQAFTTSLISTVETTVMADDRFAKFAARVLGQNAADGERAKLKTKVLDWLDYRKRINDTGSDSHWGRGRADAVGIIMATTASVVANPALAVSDREPFPASNAPVSYPFVWNANQQARLQHNGVVDNGTNFGVVKVAKIGALIRNWTEALGVFADVKLDASGSKVNSSIRLDNLMKIEQALAQLQSPQWPLAFGTLSDGARARGAQLYKGNCASCHGLLAATDTATELPLLEKPSSLGTKGGAKDPAAFIYLQPVFDQNTKPAAFAKTLNPSPNFIGTDPMMACNALMHRVPSGRFEGQTNAKGIMPSLSDVKFADYAVTTDLLRVLIQRDIFAHKADNIEVFANNQWQAAGDVLVQYAYAAIDNVFGEQGADDDPYGPLRAALQNCSNYLQIARGFAPDEPVPVYKARPLNGIWATAPYLHNGSVPTLYDLLLPQIKRPKIFGYFDGEMDTHKVGLKDASANPKAFIFRTFNEDGSVIIGNWNGGHEYGVTLDEQQRMDLLEFVKGL